MTDIRKADISRAVEEARKLMEKHPDKSRTAICQAASIAIGKPPGFLKRSTLQYRLATAPPEPQPQDGLDEIPDAAEVPVFVRDYSHQPKHLIYPVGDLHIGAAEHQGDRLDEWLKYIAKTRYTSVLNTGDNFNCAIPGSVSDTHAE